MPENRNCLPPAIPDEGNRSCDASAGAHLAGTTKREAMLPGWGERGHKPVKKPVPDGSTLAVGRVDDKNHRGRYGLR